MIISVASLKGGVGKTALCVFLSQALRACGKSVIAVDLDANNNLSDYFLRTTERSSPDWLAGGAFKESVQKTQYGVDVLPCTTAIRSLHLTEKLTLRMKKELARYDLAIIDTPPAFAAELRLALSVADLVLTPVLHGRWSLQAMAPLGKSRAVPSMVTAKQAREIAASTQATVSFISRSAAVKTACDRALPLKESSRSFQEYLALAREILGT